MIAQNLIAGLSNFFVCFCFVENFITRQCNVASACFVIWFAMLLNLQVSNLVFYDIMTTAKKKKTAKSRIVIWHLHTVNSLYQNVYNLYQDVSGRSVIDFQMIPRVFLLWTLVVDSIRQCYNYIMSLR